MAESTRTLWPALVLLAIILALGTIAFSHIEQWRLIDSFYFTATTLMTIGYGDFVPTHDSSKIFTVLFALCGVAIFLHSLGVMASFYLEKGRQFEEREVRKIREIASGMHGPIGGGGRKKR
jgi:hypothetical protein